MLKSNKMLCNFFYKSFRRKVLAQRRSFVFPLKSSILVKQCRITHRNWVDWNIRFEIILVVKQLIHKSANIRDNMGALLCCGIFVSEHLFEFPVHWHCTYVPHNSKILNVISHFNFRSFLSYP